MTARTTLFRVGTRPDIAMAISGSPRVRRRPWCLQPRVVH